MNDEVKKELPEEAPLPPEAEEDADLKELRDYLQSRAKGEGISALLILLVALSFSAGLIFSESFRLWVFRLLGAG